MMYNSKLVASIKANGKILREFKDTVYIPFNSEYSILLKNLNVVRATVSIFIDDVDVTEGVSLVVNPNSEFELSRFIKNGNLTQGNKFKFIERTNDIEQYRGIKMEDGLIRIVFQYEQHYIPAPILPQLPAQYGPGMLSGGILRGVGSSNGITTQANYCNDVGITVPGSISNQQFNTVGSFSVAPEKCVMILRLLGETPEGQVVIQPITVKTKLICSTCGYRNKATSNFCAKCGTSLKIV